MKQKKQTPQMNVILLGLAMISIGFFFSLKSLADFGAGGNLGADYSKEEFIERLRPHAEELQAGYGVLPSIIIGQAILESNWGESELASQYNNLFGMKAYGDQNKVTLDTKEFVNEQWLTIKGDFRVYRSWEESMDDHTMLFINGVDWSPEKYEKVLTAADYKEAAQALQEAGYATDPTYAAKIISVIEAYELNQYD